MSNPLLNPNDPRFRKPDVRDAEGKNRFAEDAKSAADPPREGDEFAAIATDEARPYQPEYEVQQRVRPKLLLLLAGLGWAGAVIGAVSLAGVFASGWICPLLGIGPAAAAWLLGFEDLKAIHAGAIDAAAGSRTRLATWLGLAALLACLSIVASMIYREMNFLPDVF